MEPTNNGNVNQKRSFENEGDSEQEVKRQRLDQGTIRVYKSVSNEMNTQELQARLQELDAERLKPNLRP